MPTFTVEIQASNDDFTIWQALHPAENVDSDGTPADVAADVARNQNVAEGHNWRVRVWDGADADTTTEPAAEYLPLTTIYELATPIAEQHGIDSYMAAVDAIQVMVEQIADDADLWNRDKEALTPAGVRVVTESIAQSYEKGLHGTRAALLLEQIEDKAAKIRSMEAVLADLVGDRDNLIRQALKTELRRSDIAGAAGLKEARLYQIRDGRR